MAFYTFPKNEFEALIKADNAEIAANIYNDYYYKGACCNSIVPFQITDDEAELDYSQCCRAHANIEFEGFKQFTEFKHLEDNSLILFDAAVL